MYAPKCNNGQQMLHDDQAYGSILIVQSVIQKKVLLGFPHKNQK